MAKTRKSALTEDQQEIQADVERYGALESLKDSTGGQLLIDRYLEDIIGTVNELGDGYAKLTHIEMIAKCAGMAEKLDVLHTLLNAKANRALAKAALKEALAAETEV